VELGDEQEEHDRPELRRDLAVRGPLKRDEESQTVPRAEQVSSLPQLIPRTSPFHTRFILLGSKVAP